MSRDCLHLSQELLTARWSPQSPLGLLTPTFPQTQKGSSGCPKPTDSTDPHRAEQPWPHRLCTGPLPAGSTHQPMGCKPVP